MLETDREFVAEQLAARPDAAQIEHRHGDCYPALAGQADRPLRGAWQNEWLELLQEEAGNLATAVRWRLVHEPAPLPHLFRALYPWWPLRDCSAEARPWIEELLPLAGSLDSQSRAELPWTATVLAGDIGDDPAALATRQDLSPMLEQIEDPFLRALSHPRRQRIRCPRTLMRRRDEPLRRPRCRFTESRGSAKRTHDLRGLRPASERVQWALRPGHR
jgi:hypothetical protein